MSAGSSRGRRGAHDIVEIGSELDKLSPLKLPLTRDVLRLFFYFLRRFKGKREAAWRAVKEVSKIWDTTKIPRKQSVVAVKDVEKLYEEWRAFQKNEKNPQSKAKCDDLKQKFGRKLDFLFDMGKKNAMDVLERKEKDAKDAADERVRRGWEEEKLFYIDQRGARVGTIGGKDLHSQKKAMEAAQKARRSEEIKKEKEKLLNERKMKESRKRKAEAELLQNLPTDSSSQTSQSSTMSGPKRGRVDVISPELVEALDTGEISNRQAVKVLAAMSSTVKLPVKVTNINEKTVRTRRTMLRSEAAQTIKDTFTPDQVLTVHWDGKIVPHLTEKGTKQDREAVIVTGENTAQLLGCFAVKDGTAKEISTAVVRSLREWAVVEEVKAMSFDTTNANSGFTGGAAVLIEIELGKQLLWLPCRHHVFERVLSDVYHAVMGPSSGPETQIFKNFASNWKLVDKEKYFNFMHWKESRTALSAHSTNIINFAQEQIQAGQPREDYLELLEMCIVFLGGCPSRGVRFRQPGPVHSARWMAKAIYCIKMTLFRKQLLHKKIITTKEAQGLLQITIFVVKVYMKVWFTAPLAIRAPLNDLEFLKQLITYEKDNKSVARVAQHRFSSHLWYLSEINVAFALFDERITNEDREAAVYNLHNCDGVDEGDRKRFLQIRDVPAMSIADLTTKRTKIFFNILNIKTDFLERPVSQWENCEDYREARRIVKGLKVTNDHAERCVKLMSDFNKGLTRNEKSFQELLLTVQQHRKELPNVKKENLVKKYDKKPQP